MEKGKYKTLHQKWLDQKKWEGHTDKQIAQAILIDALSKYEFLEERASPFLVLIVGAEIIFKFGKYFFAISFIK